MDNEDLLSFIACSRFKSARRRKRLQKKNNDKQLLAMSRNEDELYRRRRALPMIPLEVPYQKGWVRSFVLRADVSYSRDAAFYEELLTKINTSMYSADKLFRTRVRRKQPGERQVRLQQLRTFDDYEFFNPQFKLTELERSHFHLKLKRSRCGRYDRKIYRFNEPWRYVLQVKPRMITHYKMMDDDLNRALDQLYNRIERRHLRGRMLKLEYSYHIGRYDVSDREFNPLFNRPLHQILADVEEGLI
jgi:hypothetical protein